MTTPDPKHIEKAREHLEAMDKTRGSRAFYIQQYAAALQAAADEARAEAFEEAAKMMDARADEWRDTAKELTRKGAPTELRNHAHDMKDEALRWAKRIRAAKGGER